MARPETISLLQPEIVVPNLPDFVDSSHHSRFEALYRGLRHPSDKPTLRTTLIEAGRMFDVPQPEWNEIPVIQFDRARGLIETLTAGTHFAPLLPELLCGLGLPKDLIIQELQPQPLDFLFLSGRFGQDPLYTTLPDYLAGQGHHVATLNVVGTYADEQRRFMGLPLLTRPVDQLVILGQTQSQLGGSFKVVRHVLRTLMNKDVASQISEVMVFIPFWGGSRGHRLSQRQTMGFEVFETRASAAELANTIHEVTESLRGGKRGLTHVPHFSVYSVDIHSLGQPAKTFRRHRIKFENISPAPEFADTIYREIKDRNLLYLPIKIVACDKGAIPRTEQIAMELLHHRQNQLRYVDVVYIDKARADAGVIDINRTKVGRVIRWSLKPDGSIKKTRLTTPDLDHPDTEACVLVLTDDMGDTLGTAEIDMNISSSHFKGGHLKIFAITHPVLSKGPQNLNRIGADVVITGNTLPIDKLEKATKEGLIDPEVSFVDMAPTIARALISI